MPEDVRPGDEDESFIYMYMSSIPKEFSPREYWIENFELSAFRRNLAHSVVPVLELVQELIVIMDADSTILGSIVLGNLQRAVRTTIIDNHIFPVLIRLGQDAFDAYCQIFFRIVNGRYDANQRL